MTLKTSIEKLIQRQDLTALECQEALDEMISPDANSLQSAAFLTLLRAKKETSEELLGFILSLKEKMTAIHFPYKVLDFVGTGGDAANTINISTGAAILAASCGVKVVKNGNRAVSSLSGSADVLEALGVNIHASPEIIRHCVDEVGIGFCFAPNFHPVMMQLRDFRKKLNVPTIFNILGPLLNPANPAYIILGVMNEKLLGLISSALKKTGIEKGLVVHGCGLDEISCVGAAKLFEVTQNDPITETTLDPQDYGFTRCTISDLKGGDARENAEVLKQVFSGKKMGAITDTLVFNAAIAVWLYGVTASISDAILMVKENVKKGASLTLLQRWIECSHD